MWLVKVYSEGNLHFSSDPFVSQVMFAATVQDLQNKCVRGILHLLDWSGSVTFPIWSLNQLSDKLWYLLKPHENAPVATQSSSVIMQNAK